MSTPSSSPQFFITNQRTNSSTPGVLHRIIPRTMSTVSDSVGKLEASDGFCLFVAVVGWKRSFLCGDGNRRESPSDRSTTNIETLKLTRGDQVFQKIALICILRGRLRGGHLLGNLSSIFVSCQAKKIAQIERKNGGLFPDWV